MRDHINQRINQQDVWQGNRLTHVNRQETAKYSYLYWICFLCYFQHISVLYPLLSALKRQVIWKVLLNILPIWIWVLENLGAHRETRSNLTVDFSLTSQNQQKPEECSARVVSKEKLRKLCLQYVESISHEPFSEDSLWDQLLTILVQPRMIVHLPNQTFFKETKLHFTKQPKHENSLYQNVDLWMSNFPSGLIFTFWIYNSLASKNCAENQLHLTILRELIYFKIF